MSSPMINDLRITFIWTGTYLDLLENNNPDALPHGFLAHSHAYKTQLRALLAPSEIPSRLTLPWRTVAGQWFWTRYFGNRIPGHIKPALAWEMLVPLRARPRVAPRPVSPDTRVQAEAYCYPFGNALAVTLYFRGELSLDEVATRAHFCARDELFDMVAGSQTTGQGHLRTVAQKCLEALCIDALGDIGRNAGITSDPLTIATIVRGGNVDPALAIDNHPQKNDIQHFLEGLANWQPDWKTTALPALNSPGVLLDVSGKRSSPGDLLYAGKSHKSRGRVVWFPGRFTTSARRLSSLACYHRNLLMATAHAESLCRFLERTVARFPNRAYRNRPNVEWCTRRAAIILKDLYDGSCTYRSWSLREQLYDSDCIPAINTVLTDNGFPPIPYP